MPGGFWQHVLESDMAVPVGRPLNELTAELVTMLGSPHSVEREDVAFPVLATWLREGVYDDLLVSFGDSLARGLTVGLRSPGDDTVFRRSYSALTLAECVRRDNVATLLPVDVILSWADQAIGWYTRERDVRGDVPGKGRAGAIGHGATLLTAFASSRHLQNLHLRVLLDVIAERVTAATDAVLVAGEDDAVSLATLTVLQRNTIETDALEAWVDELASTLDRPAHLQPGTGWPTPAARNTSAYLRALQAHLAIGVRPVDATLSFAEPPECRADLLLALLRAIPRFTPDLYSTPVPANG